MDTNWQLSDMFMITRGHHILSMGGEFHDIANADLGWATQNGEFDFNGQYTGTNGASNGDPIADLLLGVPNYAHAALRGSGDYPIALQWIEAGLFVQDDWRITPRTDPEPGVSAGRCLKIPKRWMTSSTIRT